MDQNLWARLDLNQEPAVYIFASLDINRFARSEGKWACLDSNQEPVVYKTTALPLSYTPICLPRFAAGYKTAALPLSYTTVSRR